MTETMTPTEIWVEGQEKVIEESYEAWKRGDPVRRDDTFMELLVANLVTLGELCRQKVQESWRGLQQSPTTYPAQEKGENLSKFLTNLIRLYDTVEEGVLSYEARDEKFPRAEQFKAAHEALVSLNERFLDGWPMLDVKAAQQAQADARAGRFFTLEDIAGAMDNPV